MKKNWVADLLACENGRALTKRTCNEIDDLIIEVDQELNPTRHIELYTQIEEAFFGPDGEHPIIPIFARAPFHAIHSWYDYTPHPLLWRPMVQRQH